MKTFDSIEVLQLPPVHICTAVKSALVCKALDLPQSEIFKSHKPTDFEAELARLVYENFELD